MMSTARVRGLSWDDFDGYLFDIDGTLLHCSDAVHYFAFCEALKTITGRDLTLEGVVAHGNTDVGILRDALRIAGVEEGTWRHRLVEIQDAMGRFVAKHQQDVCAIALPHVRGVLEHLRDRGAKLGVATGNLREIGRIKLEVAGLLDFFEVEGWSDGYEYRTDVFHSAVELMRAATGESATICIIGDTPADVESAQANNLPVIAVATGVYARERLLESAPDLCLESFADLSGFA